MASSISAPISRPLPLFISAALLRLGMLLYGLWQDANSPLKYTDIDYLVFTDAARLTSPYERETYRYTPLLAWLLYPTVSLFFSFGKVVFAAADLLAGYLILLILQRHLRMSSDRACRFAAIWLLNPMVATISTRGSSEGLLGVLVTALLWAVLERRVVLSGLLLGLGVHFKIYPFIYAPAVIWWMDAERMGSSSGKRSFFVTWPRIQVTLVSLAAFMGLNMAMYALYGLPFVTHTYLHHVTRIDHRHNFSPYNVLLYLTSSESSSSSSSSSLSTPWARIESVAFVPQLLLSTVLIPFVGAKKDLATTMMAQTFAFVTFNKVCTSQYFLWYMVFLPLYLPNSSLLRRSSLGITVLVLWVLSQALWLQQGYNLEFLGLSTFVPGLWTASLVFFIVNCFILGVVIEDLGISCI
ncbi:glycosyltransferase family 50 protein [Poronia punctata]|nr:glycosyltransferase family 50 protein [Poronia punctata]